MHSAVLWARMLLSILTVTTLSQEALSVYRHASAPVAVRGRRARSRTRRREWPALAPADDAGDPGSALAGAVTSAWTLTREAATVLAARLRTVASHALSTLDAPLVSHFPQLR